VPFDGILNDMNEPSNFINGSFDGCPKSKYEDPQYLPGLKYKLHQKTICMTAKQHAGLHYNVHNLFGLTQAMASNV
jgi:lysosomal alpha-glucosidase